MKAYKLGIIACITLGLAACSSKQTVNVVKGDKNIDYSQPKNIHISESNTVSGFQKIEQVKPRNATALCVNGSYSIDIQNPCANEGGVKLRFSHYYAD
ncbi:hypothetical protein [Mannheimia granulomatis]|uniref:hypothetical protein n=1 Tax=Mannheimia granulomatis TaxID=85402 RepID=UPI00047D9BD5|nr:hypothetical protein [Mannheimia granulomatis]QLB19430.1 hypothetical protein A6B41_08215 [Mannheimia granulomatis]